ncbi:DUF4292 domain-containing protein [Fibrella sp. HMF5335]|uniref:DUF4292 domain-containing protein n=1 Tax=Fibrella rubiginis TaxID=2817060 RepID=A0A939K1A7_9BACT|nr:DUF4292 domain-containing protein [Fibrella rubiginis]MBO0935049.1 DUF4292 domain-containing protein [Fibrella rubiginis]
MKKQLVLLTAALLVSVGTFAQTATDVVNKHIAAIGGIDKIKAIKSAQYDQHMSIAGMEMTGKTVVVVGQAMRADVTVMGSQVTQVINGDKGWSVNPMQGGSTPQDTPADQVALSKGNTELTGLQLAYASLKGYPMVMKGTEKMGTADRLRVDVTRPEATVSYYLDPQTYYITNTKATVMAGGQKVDVESTFANYKAVEGITMPFSVDLKAPGMPSNLTTIVDKVTLNPTIDPAIFNKPK